MPNECGNIKAILEDAVGRGLSSTAKLVAILEACGISDRAQVEALLELKPSTLREARSALKIQRQKSSAVDATAGNPAPEIQRSAGNPAQTPEIQRQKSSVSSCAHATKELPSEVLITNKQTDRASAGSSVGSPPAELKQAFNGSTENLLTDIQRWMNADRIHAVKWLTSMLDIAGSEGVLKAYSQILDSQTKGKLIADPIRYLGKIAPTLKAKQSPATGTPGVIVDSDGKRHRVTSTVRYAKPREEAVDA